VDEKHLVPRTPPAQPRSPLVARIRRDLSLGKPRGRVLWVEDNESCVSVVKHYFDRWGLGRRLDITFTENGDEALERLRASPPDALVTDSCHPGADYREFVETIQATPTLRHVRTVLTYGDCTDHRGFDLVLDKPWSELDLTRLKAFFESIPQGPGDRRPAGGARRSSGGRPV
jgi:CheY-like chemotaxis protein